MASFLGPLYYSLFSRRASRRLIRSLLTAVALLITLYILDFSFLGKSRRIKIVRSSYNWQSLPPYHPVESFTPLPSGLANHLPKVQYAFNESETPNLFKTGYQRGVVRQAFQKCWTSYKKFAWMKDELAPVSASYRTTFGGWAATLIDSLDTLWIMDLKDEFYEAVEAVATLDWASTNSTSCNIFETTIRHLGGLLSAYDLSQEQVLLDKAIELGQMLYAGFDTPNRMPPFWLDFQKAKDGLLVSDNHQPSASPGSLSLEFTRLAQLTGDDKYYDAISRITTILDDSQNETKLPGMWPIYFDLRNDINLTRENRFSVGGQADSLYEYLPKMFALLGGRDPTYKKLYRNAAKTIEEQLLFRPMLPSGDNILFAGTATVNDGQIDLEPESEHLTCFVGGMFALGGRLFGNEADVELGKRLTNGCIYAYNAFPTGIMPEIFSLIKCRSQKSCRWDESRWRNENKQSTIKGFPQITSRKYILRPEAIESVFLLYRITGDTDLQDAAWNMFTSIQTATETRHGNAAIEDVTTTGSPKHVDSMESFWLAETLKYFYLIFSPPDLIDLDEYVFNTEAHPFKRPA